VEYEVEVDGKTYSIIGENNFLNITDGDLLLGIGELDGVMYIVTN
jgi:hypothetical protein